MPSRYEDPGDLNEVLKLMVHTYSKKETEDLKNEKFSGKGKAEIGDASQKGIQDHL